MEKSNNDKAENKKKDNSKKRHSIDSISFNLKSERRRRKERFKEITNTALPFEFFKKVVELENIIIKEKSKENYFELLDLYKVFFFNN